MRNLKKHLEKIYRKVALKLVKQGAGPPIRPAEAAAAATGDNPVSQEAFHVSGRGLEVACFSGVRESRNAFVLHGSSNESWTVQKSPMTERMLHVLSMQVQRPRAVLFMRERE